MTRSGADIVSVIEAAYAAELDDAAWVQGIVDACEPIVDHGKGIFAVRYDLARSKVVGGSTVKLQVQPAVLGTSCAVPAGFIDRMGEYFPRPLLPVYGGPYHCDTAIGNVRRLCPEMMPMFDAMSNAAGLADIFGVAGTSPSGQGLLLQAPSPTPIDLKPSARKRWQRVAIHLSCGLRLRERQAKDALADAEAIVSPDGRLEHAAGAARDRHALTALRRAAVDIDRARAGSRRGDAEGALDLWQALVAGRWTLVDHFERGGRRYYLARPNAPAWRAPRRLTPAERQVVLGVATGASNKVVAYDLGLPVTTVASMLSRALGKLGLRRRGELQSLVAVLRGPARARDDDR